MSYKNCALLIFLVTVASGCDVELENQGRLQQLGICHRHIARRTETTSYTKRRLRLSQPSLPSKG